MFTQISGIVLPYNKSCTPLLLERIVSARHLDSDDPQMILIVVAVKVMPSNGVFEATLKYSKLENEFAPVKHITRINKYGDQSWCVNDIKLKPFCFCFSKKS